MEDIDNIIKDIKDNVSETELDAIYIYLEMNYETFTEQEKIFWIELLKRIDPEFYDD